MTRLMTQNKKTSPGPETLGKPQPAEPKTARVEDIMTIDVVSVRPDASVGRIARLMHEKAISGVPVVDEGRRLLGMVTDLDLIVRNTRIEPPAFFPILDGGIPLETTKHFKKRIQHMVGTTARDVMTEQVLTIGPEGAIETLADLMVKRHVNMVPVVEFGRLVGVVARADVIQWMVRDEDWSAPNPAS
jgi:CBS-domain-containing membrane protein